MAVYIHVSRIIFTLKFLNINHLKKYIKVIVLTKYEKFWAQFRLNSINGKLRTYFSFKDHFGTEQYLSVNEDFDKIHCFTKFRISSHKLKNETGRFTRPHTPLEQRVCDHCLKGTEIFGLCCSNRNYRP